MPTSLTQKLIDLMDKGKTTTEEKIESYTALGEHLHKQITSQREKLNSHLEKLTPNGKDTKGDDKKPHV